MSTDVSRVSAVVESEHSHPEYCRSSQTALVLRAATTPVVLRALLKLTVVLPLRVEIDSTVQCFARWKSCRIGNEKVKKKPIRSMI